MRALGGAPSASPPRRARRAGVLRMVLAALSMAALAATPAGRPAALAQETDASLPPVCEDLSGPLGDCQLPRWPIDGAAALPSLFGEVDPGGGVWVTDPAGDAPPAGLDILAVGIARVSVVDAATIRASAELLRKGGKKKAVPGGDAVLVRVLLERPPDALEKGHVAVFVATDVDGVRSNNAPLGVAAPDGPFADFQEAYSIHALAGHEGVALLQTDLSRKRWYRGRTPFAAARPAPEVLDVLLTPQSTGDLLRLVSWVDADGGGYDVAGLGPTRSRIPLDGAVGTLPLCVEGSLSSETFTVPRLVENGQTFRDIDTPRSWLGGATFALADTERRALEALMASRGTASEEILEVDASMVLIDEGLNVRQTAHVELRLPDDGAAHLAFQVGLARRGYHVLRDIEPQDSGDALVDAFLHRATAALVAAMPPFRSTQREGPLLGGGAGSCLPSGPARTA